MPKITSSAKAGDFNTFDNTVRDAGHAVCALTESAAQVNHSVMVFVYRVRKNFARIFFCDWTIFVCVLRLYDFLCFAGRNVSGL